MEPSNEGTITIKVIQDGVSAQVQIPECDWALYNHVDYVEFVGGRLALEFMAHGPLVVMRFHALRAMANGQKPVTAQPAPILLQGAAIASYRRGRREAIASWGDIEAGLPACVAAALATGRTWRTPDGSVLALAANAEAVAEARNRS